LADGKKMSKSKGNLYTLEDVKEKGFSAMDLRLFFLSSHYRSQMEFSWQALEQAHKNLQKINDFVLNLEAISTSDLETTTAFDISTYQEKFESALDDDLNTPLALSKLYEFITQVNKQIDENTLASADAKKILSLWKKINHVFGLVLLGQAEIPQEIKRLIEQREIARSGKDFQKSDDLRALIEKKGYLIEDTKDGMKVKVAGRL
jgi:cysteinyl-tRNA synthetase